MSQWYPHSENHSYADEVCFTIELIRAAVNVVGSTESPPGLRSSASLLLCTMFNNKIAQMDALHKAAEEEMAAQARSNK